MKSPQDKAAPYTLVVIIMSIVVAFVIGYITSVSVGLGPTFV
jgi:hypothetical protein